LLGGDVVRIALTVAGIGRTGAIITDNLYRHDD
jgi:hypothetical protein